MKCYYDNSGTWTLITKITTYPTIIDRNNSYSYCTIEIGDMDGALYGTWEPRDFTKILVTDGNGSGVYTTTTENIIFRGYLINKLYTEPNLTLTVASFGIMLDWKPFLKNYILEEGMIRTVPGTAILTMFDDLDENGEYTDATEDFSWGVDYWHTDQDLGLMVVDNTNDVSSSIWYCSAIASTDETSEDAGDENSLDDKNDGDSYDITEAGLTWNAFIEPTMNEGDDIDDTLKLNKIEIEYRIGFKVTSGGPKKEWYITVDYDGTPKEVKRHLIHSTAGIEDWQEGIITIEGTDAVLQNYLTKTGADYTDLTELKIHMSFEGGTTFTCTGNLYIDYLAVTIYYYNFEIAPITETITDNAASTITCAGVTWDETGVKINDRFKIAQNTVQVVADIASQSGLPIDIIGLTSSAAGTFTLRPNGDGTQTEWSFDDSGGDGSHFKDVDEVVVDPNAGDTNIVYTSHNSPTWVQEEFDYTTDVMGGANVCTKIELHTYGTRTAIGGLCSAYMFTTSTGWSASRLPIDKTDGSYGWKTVTWDNLNLAQAELDSLQIRYEAQDLAGFGAIVKVDTSYITAHYGVYSPYEKYTARYYKGINCRQTLDSIRKLEGSFWMEDHINERIKLVRPANYELSDVNLSQSEYGYDWEFEDKCNQVRRVDVFGSAANNIHCWKVDDTVSGYITKTIIDDSILTKADAQEVADTQLLIYDSKTPSIKMNLDGTYPNLQLGYTANITMVRPTVGAADYPIRMIRRTPVGKEIRTTIWAGLGETADDEKIANTIRHALNQANRALSDRLTSTPWTAGASLGWGDIAGADAAVTAIHNALGGDIQDSIPLQLTRVGDGTTIARFAAHTVAAYPAADNDCTATWTGYMPKGWTAMINPTLIFYMAAAAGDTWGFTIQADASGDGESLNLAGLYNAGTTGTKIGAAWLMTKKEVPLTGTISAGDIVSVEITKTTVDAQIMYIPTTIWIERA